MNGHNSDVHPEEHAPAAKSFRLPPDALDNDPKFLVVVVIGVVRSLVVRPVCWPSPGDDAPGGADVIGPADEATSIGLDDEDGSFERKRRPSLELRRLVPPSRKRSAGRVKNPSRWLHHEPRPPGQVLARHSGKLYRRVGRWSSGPKLVDARSVEVGPHRVKASARGRRDLRDMRRETRHRGQRVRSQDPTIVGVEDLRDDPPELVALFHRDAYETSDGVEHPASPNLPLRGR